MLLLKIVIVLIVAATLDGLLPKYWEGFSYVDLPLIITVYVALMRDPLLAMGVGCTAGLLGDVLPAAGPVVGVNGFTKTTIGFFIAMIGVRFSLEGPLMRVFVLAVASLVNSIMIVGLYGLFDYSIGAAQTTAEMLRVLGFQTAANLVLGVFIFWLLDRVFSEKVAEGQMRVRRRFYE